MPGVRELIAAMKWRSQTLARMWRSPIGSSEEGNTLFIWHWSGKPERIWHMVAKWRQTPRLKKLITNQQEEICSFNEWKLTQVGGGWWRWWNWTETSCADSNTRRDNEDIKKRIRWMSVPTWGKDRTLPFVFRWEYDMNTSGHCVEWILKDRTSQFKSWNLHYRLPQRIEVVPKIDESGQKWLLIGVANMWKHVDWNQELGGKRGWTGMNDLCLETVDVPRRQLSRLLVAWRMREVSHDKQRRQKSSELGQRWDCGVLEDVKI